MWYQTQIESGKSGQICWLDRRLRAGQVVTIEDGIDASRRWTVIEQYSTPSEHPGRRRWGVHLPDSERTELKRR